MKKISAFILSFITVLLLFAACNSDKEAVLTGKDLLIGNWEAAYDVSGLDFYVQFTFNADGTLKTSVPEESYKKTLENANDEMKAKISENLPYEDASALFDSTGTWKLEGDTLTMTIGETTQTAKTGLSKGEKTFTVESDGAKLVFNKK